LQLSILILAPDRASAKSLSEPLTAAGHGVTVVGRPGELAAAAAGYSVVVLDAIADPTAHTDVISLLKGSDSTARVPILCVAKSADLDERITLIEAGADEVIARPFQNAELLARVEAMVLQGQRPAAGGGARAIGDPLGKRVIAVFSPKGGVGTTTIATNLALLAAERFPNKVALLDLDLSYGQVASHLNLEPKQTLLELTRDESALGEKELFRTYLIQLPGGLHVLAAPPSPSFANLVRADHVNQVVARSVENYDVVVIDAGTSMDDRHEAVFERADTVIVPVLPEIPALKAARLLVEQLSETGSLGSQTMFVLNNLFAGELLRRSDIETALGAKIWADLPYHPLVYLRAVNEGIPVVLGAPKSAPAEKLRALAIEVLGSPDPPARSDAGKKERKGLFGRH
jgi:pilus assembly protein CpaE